MIALLLKNPLLLLFLVSAIGYALGRITIAGSSLGVAAVLFVGLAFGALHPDLKLPDLVYQFGLVVFVYTIGLSSGHQFFRSLGRKGLRDNLLVLGLLTGATSLTLLLGWLLLTGTLGFFLYTYTSMTFGTTYNPLFLLYVALWSLSLCACILSIQAIEVAALPQHFSPRLPRRSIAGLLLAAAAFLLVAWLGRIVPPLLRGETPALENTTTLFIQALDLGLIVPLSFVSGVLLLGRKAWGYLLASVAVLKFLTLGLAVSAMGINMARIGVPISPIELVVFPALALVNLIIVGLLLKHIEVPARTPRAA